MKFSGALISAFGLSTLLVQVGCRTDEPQFDAGFGHPDLGFVTPPPDSGVPAADTGVPDMDSGPAADGGVGGPDTGVTTVTVADLLAMRTQLNTKVVALDNVVVTATIGGVGGASGTFYVQDSSPAGPGIAVFRSRTGNQPMPNVGDTVTVIGRYSTFNGSLQVSGSAAHSVALSVVIHGPGGHVLGGAYPPAGMPIPMLDSAMYSHTMMDNHSGQLGNTLQFAGPLTVTSSRAFVATDQDGGTHTEGFEVTGGLWVDDSNVFRDCIRTLDGGVLDLSHGIRGVWDRYQDFYAGTPQNHAPVVPVLIPLNCSDLNPR